MATLKTFKHLSSNATTVAAGSNGNNINSSSSSLRKKQPPKLKLGRFFSRNSFSFNTPLETSEKFAILSASHPNFEILKSPTSSQPGYNKITTIISTTNKGIHSFPFSSFPLSPIENLDNTPCSLDLGKVNTSTSNENEAQLKLEQDRPDSDDLYNLEQIADHSFQESFPLLSFSTLNSAANTSLFSKDDSACLSPITPDHDYNDLSANLEKVLSDLIPNLNVEPEVKSENLKRPSLQFVPRPDINNDSELEIPSKSPQKPFPWKHRRDLGVIRIHASGLKYIESVVGVNLFNHLKLDEPASTETSFYWPFLDPLLSIRQEQSINAVDHCSIIQLIDGLTSASVIDAKLLRFVLFIRPYFISAQDFCRLLIIRYVELLYCTERREKLLLSPLITQLDTYREKAQRLRVLNIIKKWVENCPWDFAEPESNDFLQMVQSLLTIMEQEREITKYVQATKKKLYNIQQTMNGNPISNARITLGEEVSPGLLISPARLSALEMMVNDEKIWKALGLRAAEDESTEEELSAILFNCKDIDECEMTEIFSNLRKNHESKMICQILVLQCLLWERENEKENDIDQALEYYLQGVKDQELTMVCGCCQVFRPYVEMVRIWVEKYREDFIKWPEGMEILRWLIKRIRDKSECESLTKLTVELLASASLDGENMQPTCQDILAVNPNRLAQGLMKLSRLRFCRIPLREFLRDKRGNGSPLPPFLHQHSAEFNRICFATTMSILCLDTPQKRACAIYNILQITDICHYERDFDTTAALVAGFSHCSITRLKNTWSEVDEVTLQKVTYYQSLYSASMNYIALRKYIRGELSEQELQASSLAQKQGKNRSSSRNTLPPLFTYLTELLSIEESSSFFQRMEEDDNGGGGGGGDEKKRLNLNVIRLLGQRFVELADWKESAAAEIENNLDPELDNWIQQWLRSTGKMSQDWLYGLSKKREMTRPVSRNELMVALE